MNIENISLSESIEIVEELMTIDDSIYSYNPKYMLALEFIIDYVKRIALYYTDTEVRQIIINDLNKVYKQIDNLTIETRPISPEQETKFLYYNMAVDDCLKVVRAYLESVAK